MKKYKIDLRNQVFGYWTVIEYMPMDSSGKRKIVSAWLCECICGTKKQVRQGHLRNGSSTNCGCKRRIKNGLSETRLNKIYTDMIQRCTNPKRNNYKWYGAIGINVCLEWINDFFSFYDWAIANGYEENLTLDRIDSKGDYEPDNCRWSTIKEQQNNKRNNIHITINNETRTLAQWAEHAGINKNTLYSRYFRGGKRGEELITKEA